MTRLNRAFAWILLSFMSFGILAGYAAVTDTLNISGTASFKEQPYEGVYISEVSLVFASGATSVSYDYYKPTNMTSTVRVTSSGGNITYKITVHNNTDVTYWYIGPNWMDEFESNALISASGGITITTKDSLNDSGQTFNNEDWIPPNTKRDFYVTYSFGVSALAQVYISTLVNFKFGVHMDAVHDEFLTVLNDKISEVGYNYISKIFDEKYAEDGTTVIGNIGEDKEIFDRLFGENITVNIDGIETPVTVMIQRDNVDNRQTGDDYSGTAGAPTGCEYTIYITVDPLDSPTGTAMVYAVSYSNGGSGAQGDTWYQLGQLYEGTAPVVDYDSSDGVYEGAFDITRWIATEGSYEIADGLIYKVGCEQGDQYDKLKTLEEIMSTNDQDIFNDIDNTRILQRVYSIVYSSENHGKSGYAGLRDAFTNAAPFYDVYNNGQEVKVRRNCTRAEIIPYILAIQTALDYYNEVNP